ncbi:4-hydroxy-tetrahydrodipicolinate reductase [Candidatus Phycosocius spiralis]|uniref:4-hydroxy-tetrahydrodipicolinate reductase n=2 Tax=Candidatus Phycosocius spiralis TaxID=2815099 RepID=A0ABQ4PXF0_9PROT|nr:4-hydroxy-tetrahydrodipicolinate reductase [Candidatus Phycosocius spiralis]
MGRALLEAAYGDPRFAISGGTQRLGSNELGMDLGVLCGQAPLGRCTSSEVAEAADQADIWLDFTTPSAFIAAVPALRASSIRTIILGTTGFDGTQEREIEEVATRFSVVRSGNFSFGVTVLVGLVQQAAARLGTDFDIEILETHHRHKLDAPSGTALMLGQAAATGRGVDHGKVATGHSTSLGALRPPNAPRQTGDIGYASRRAGGIMGEHEVMFASDTETIRLSHTAINRSLFAKGALVAAFWAKDQPPGLYSMSDVLNL